MQCAVYRAKTLVRQGADASQARDDLAGRRTLVEEGYPLNDRVSRYQDVGFDLVEARIIGSGIRLDVAPLDGSPVHVFRHVQMTPTLFAICGSVSE